MYNTVQYFRKNLKPDHGSECDTEWVEYLVGRIQPDRWFQQHLKLYQQGPISNGNTQKKLMMIVMTFVTNCFFIKTLLIVYELGTKFENPNSFFKRS
jgi:hypothetical protein